MPMTDFLKNNRRVLWGIFALFLIIGLTVIFPALVKAAGEEPTAPDAINAAIGNLDQTSKDAQIVNSNSATPKLATIIGQVINIALGVFTMIFFILIVYGGIVWLTAGGDKAKADKAQTILTNAVLGVIIIIIAYLLTNFILFRIIGITIK
ncbi:MAG: hypothetical protein NTZ18_00230 [Candidatus Komeilibacteria bacterium]|nr:hypothetical protein [Candidatus Komeilibacteria bacterium]